MLVTLTYQTNVESAYILKGCLEHEGIPAVVTHDNFATMYWLASTAMGGVPVWVPASLYEQALEVLENRRAGVYENELNQQLEPGESDADENIICPKCQSVNQASLMPGRRFLYLMFLTGGSDLTGANASGFAALAVFFLIILFNVFDFIRHALIGMHYPMSVEVLIPFVVIATLIPLVYPFRFKNHLCNKCGHRWYAPIRKLYLLVDRLVIFFLTTIACYLVFAGMFSVIRIIDIIESFIRGFRGFT